MQFIPSSVIVSLFSSVSFGCRYFMWFLGVCRLGLLYVVDKIWLLYHYGVLVFVPDDILVLLSTLSFF